MFAGRTPHAQHHTHPLTHTPHSSASSGASGWCGVLFRRGRQDVFLALYGTPLAAVAAIDGHAPAGGCLLASACDERVMARGKFGIGLNETQARMMSSTREQNRKQRMKVARFAR